MFDYKIRPIFNSLKCVSINTSYNIFNERSGFS